MRRLFWRASKWAFVSLVILLIIGVAALFLVPSFTPAREGCYWTNAMISYIECSKIPAGRLIAFILNLPFFVFFYSGMFAFHWIRSGLVFSQTAQILPGFLVCLAYLAPLVVGGLYPIHWLSNRVRSRRS